MLAGPQRVVEYKTRCKPRNHRAGVTVEFPLRPGHVSFLKMDMLGEGCKLFYYKGEVTTPTCELRGNQATIRPDTRVKALIEKLLDHGVSHHQVLSLGDVTREVKYFAELAGLELVCL
jgi:L-arabinose isomerase